MDDMASNNRKHSQQPFAPKGGRGGKVNSSNPNSHQQKDLIKKKVQHTLKDMFINVFDYEIIQSVAHNCNWKLNKSIETLIMLSEDSGRQTSFTAQKKYKQHSANHGSKKFKEAAIPTTNKLSKNIPELSYKKSVKSRHENKILSEVNSVQPKKAFTSGNKHQNLLQRTHQSSKKVVMGEGPRTIKVAYKGANQLDSSDDDADVVIEEENEFEIVGNESSVGMGAFTFPGNSYPSVCQFVTPILPCIPQKVSHRISQKPQIYLGTGKQINSTPPYKTKVMEGSIASGKMEKPRGRPVTIEERIKKLIMGGIKVMVFMRGCPGSGKSFIAKQIISTTVGGNHNKYVFSTDNYFQQIGGGKYTFLPSRLPEAHSWNQNRVLNEAKQGTNPIIVDNTNLEVWEMQPYAIAAVKYGYSLELLEPSTAWRYDPAELAHRNVHGVPRRRLEEMLDRFERDITSSKLLSFFKLKYSASNKPPQPSAKPPIIHTRKCSTNTVTVPKKSKKKNVPTGKSEKMQTQSNTETDIKSENDAPESNLTDVLAVFFAKKVQEKGQPVDPDIFKRRLMSGHTIEDVLTDMCKLQNVQSEKVMPPPSISETDDMILGSAVSTQIEEDRRRSSSNSAIRPFEVPVDDAGSSSDFANDSDGSDSIEISDGVSIGDEESEVIGDLSEGDGEYLSDENDKNMDIKSSDFSDSCVEDEVSSQFLDEDKLPLLADGTENTCKEYVLVLEDKTLVFQKLHDDSSESISKEVLVCSPLDSRGRYWEYIVGSEDVREMSQVKDVNSDMCTELQDESLTPLDNIKEEFSISKFQTEAMQNVNMTSYDETKLSNGQTIENSIRTDGIVIKSQIDHSLLTQITDGISVEPDNISVFETNKPEDLIDSLESLVNFVSQSDNSAPETLEEETDCAKVNKSDLGSASSMIDLRKSSNLELLMSTVESVTEREFKSSPGRYFDELQQLTDEQEEYAPLQKEDGVIFNETMVDNPDTILNSAVNSSLFNIVQLPNNILSGIELQTDANISSLDEFYPQNMMHLSGNLSETENDSNLLAELDTKLHSNDDVDPIMSDYLDSNDIRNGKMHEYNIIQSEQEEPNIEKSQNPLAISSDQTPVINPTTYDAINQWIKSVDQNSSLAHLVDTQVLNIDAVQNKCSNINVNEECVCSVDLTSQSDTEKTSDACLEVPVDIKDSKIHEATSAEEEFESAVSSSASDDDDDIHDSKCNNTHFKIIEEVPKIDFVSMIKGNTEVPVARGSPICDRKDSEPANSQDIGTVPISASDIIKEWEQGKMWNEVEQEPVEDLNLADTAPKPARRQRHSDQLRTSERPCSDVDNGSSKEILPPAEVQAWSAVAESIISWEETDTSVSSHVSHTSTEPQPQRLLFSTSLAKQEIGGSPSLWKSSTQVIDTTLEDSGSEGNISQKLLTIGDELTGGVKDVFSFQNLSNHFEPSSDMFVNNTTSDLKQNKENSSTNTHYSDFILLRRANEVVGAQVPPEVSVVTAHNRNILEGHSPKENFETCRALPQVLLLDKSSMTIQGEEVEETDLGLQFKELARTFPGIPLDNLREIYKKCNMDANWTADVILESEMEGMEPAPENGESCDLAAENFENGPHENAEEGSDFLIPETFELEEEFDQSVTDSTSHHQPSSSECKFKRISPSKRNTKKEVNTPMSEINLQLKKQLEENVVISDKYYSEHTLRIRKMRHGEVAVDEDRPLGVCIESSHTQGSSVSEGTEGNHCAIKADNVYSEENAPVYLGHAVEGDVPMGSEVDQTNSSFEEEETIPLSLDSKFVDHLHQLFGSPGLPLQQGTTPVVNLPLSLARQIHYYLMESQQAAYEKMIQEDEELAHQLQIQEQQSLPSKVPDLREIMDMEMAMALYKADQAQWRSHGKDDLATKLSKQLLCDTFPTLPQDVLMEVFEAHDNSFSSTLEVLLASTEENSSAVINVLSPEARAAHEQELMKQAQLENLKYSQVAKSPTTTLTNDEATQESAFEDANYYRSEASRHYQLRNECYKKAQDAYRNGLTSVASYYSQVAILHKQRIDDLNACAASSLLLAHTLGNMSTTLDLHFLYVAEALQVLDIFLDHHVQRLGEEVSLNRQETLFIVTGRGSHSLGGRSRIKPAVARRLEWRGLKYVEVNPGLLKVLVSKHIPLSSSFSN